MDKQKREMKKKTKIVLTFSLTIFIFLFVTSLISYFVLTRIIFPPEVFNEDEKVKGIEYVPQKENTKTILFIGEDNNKLHSLMLIRVQPLYNEISCVPVPLSTVAKINTKEKTVNEFYELGGVDFLRTALENSFDMPIQRYIIIDNATFKDFVANIGEIPYSIPTDMYYKNSYTGEVTNLKCKNADKIYNGDELRKIMTYPLHPLGEQFNVNISGGIIASLINENTKETEDFINNLDDIINCFSDVKGTNITEYDFQLLKKDLIYILNKSTTPASYNIPEGEWNKNDNFILDKKYKEELKKYFHIESE